MAQTPVASQVETNSVENKVDLHCRENNTAHHTNEITEDQLIVRRGQTFTVTLDLKKTFNSSLDTLTFIAETGEKPEYGRGTRTVFSIPTPTAPPQDAIAVWKAELVSGDKQQSVTLNVFPSAEAPIGHWSLFLETSQGTDAEENDLLGSLYILFNPWCEEDWVYLENDDWRQEYVMNENGIIYRGSKDFISPLHWDYGQFEEEVLDICLKMLDLNPKHEKDPADDVSARCNPLYVSRVISAMVNSAFDRGVLEGNWGGDYRGGCAPSHWDGSVDILQQWSEHDCHPVKYGQCWVFAGVMCSVMRCLGIPCRVVTNFNSAHDTDANMTIDKYYREDGVALDSNDSIWNFHVWTEGWMKRPDLSGDGSYDGWQVLDPTPQELSAGTYCCGPTSVTAIYCGHVLLKYDVPFVYAEVNADIRHFLVNDYGAKFMVHSEEAVVGQNISTKAIGSKKREDITQNYKPEEGTCEERRNFYNAIEVNYQARKEKEKKEKEEAESTPCEPPPDEATTDEPPQGETTPDKPPPEEETPTAPRENRLAPFGTISYRTPVVRKKLLITFEQENEPVNGQDISEKLSLNIEDQDARSFSVQISVQAMRYTGVEAAKIQNEKVEVVVNPETALSVPITIPFKVYGKHMLECDSLKVSVRATDKQHPDLVYYSDQDIVLKDPPITITLIGEARVYDTVVAKVEFQNPIDETLKNCTMTLSGSGLLKTHEEISLPDLKPGHRYRIQCRLIPYRKGTKTLSVDLDCSHFRDIKASVDIDVK